MVIIEYEGGNRFCLFYCFFASLLAIGCEFHNIQIYGNNFDITICYV